MLVLSACVDGEVNKVGRSSGSDWPFHPKYFSCDHLGMDLVILILWDVPLQEFLVLGLTELVLGIKVDPELEADARLLKAGRHFGVHDAFAGCHPLDISRSD